MVSKLIVSLMVLSGLMFGQSGSASTSTYAIAFTNVAVATATGSFSNIGQTSHFVSLTFSNAPAQTCVATGNFIRAGLEYSFDLTTWIAFGTPNRTTVFQLTGAGGSTITFYGSGAFPFVRFNLSGFDTTNCRASAYYTGSSNTTSFINNAVFTGSLVTLSLGSDSYPSIASNSAPVNIIGAVTGGLAVPVIACGDTVITPTNVAAGTFHLISPQVGRIVYLCGFTATSSGVATVQIVQGSGATCTTSGAVSPQFNLVAGVPLSVGQNLGTLYQITAVNDVCIVTTGANVAFQARWTTI